MTTHIKANKEQIAKTVIMPGDPLRAKFIAENFLTEYELVSSVRNIYAYTGLYKNQKVTIMASGMGTASMGIYAYELYKYYDVENIIRIGSCGTFKENINLFDVILVENSVSESSFYKSFANNDTKVIEPSSILNEKITASAVSLNKKIIMGNIFCSEAFYNENGYKTSLINEYNCLGVEMESFSLFAIAKVLNKQAACILTVSDSLITKKETTSEEREKSFTEMMEIALNTVL